MNVQDCIKTFTHKGKTVRYFSLPALADRYQPGIHRFPQSLRIMLEGVLRKLNHKEVTAAHVADFIALDPRKPSDVETPYMPARVLLQDFTGVPCVVDLAAMRSAVARLGRDPSMINPRLPVDLVVDHSVNTDFFATNDAFRKNLDLEFQRNRERYELLRWAQGAFRNFSVVPPASGICHQVNLEYLAKVVQFDEDTGTAYFDSLVGTDSHTTMINGLGVLGWGVGGIEAEAAMLGQPVYMLVPPVVGVRVTGSLRAGVSSTDAVLALTQMLRKHGVVNKIVEFFGPGLSTLSVPDRATLANMAPEYGATAGYFPVDDRTLEYLYQTGRDADHIALVEAYYKAQGMFRTESSPDPEFQTVLEFNLSTIVPSLAGPKRPQDRLDLGKVPQSFRDGLTAPVDARGFGVSEADREAMVRVTTPRGTQEELGHGAVVISSITSCTNTSSPSLMITAGLVARNARQRGLATKPWVKTSFAPGSVVVTQYLQKAGLMESLEELGFNLVGYGCMTCIGNSGNLPPGIAKPLESSPVVAAAVLSGNRNFEGRVNPLTKANYLASPPLCVAYALAGSVLVDLDKDPLGHDTQGRPVFLKDLWPSPQELETFVSKALERNTFQEAYRNIQQGNEEWNTLTVPRALTYEWKTDSTYIQEPPFFAGLRTDGLAGGPVTVSFTDGRCLALFGDSITTDHISPAGNISAKSPAGQYLQDHGVAKDDFNSYGSRRGNDQVMTRGTFANIRLRNRILPGTEGGVSIHLPDGVQDSIFAVAMRYRDEGVPTVILAGKDYGMGSSRDWAAKGVKLLGVQVVIAESYERIHRSNLVGMGVLPLQFIEGDTVASLGLTGYETFRIPAMEISEPKMRITVEARDEAGVTKAFPAVVRLDSTVEMDYYRQGGILPAVLTNMLS